MSVRTAIAKIRVALDELERALDAISTRDRDISTRAFGRGVLTARDLQCPTCRARPGEFCRALRRPNRGKRAQGPHNARLALARAQRNVEQ